MRYLAIIAAAIALIALVDVAVTPVVGGVEVALEHATEEIRRVPEITGVGYSVDSSDPSSLIVTAEGMSSNYALVEPLLLRRTYVNPPADGVWEFDLLAKRNSKPGVPGGKAIKAIAIWKNYDQSIYGIRVYGGCGRVKEVRYHSEGCK
jgi:hypothetical protein